MITSHHHQQRQRHRPLCRGKDGPGLFDARIHTSDGVWIPWIEHHQTERTLTIMRDQDKNRDPERAQKRALADGRCAWRKMGPDQRHQFLQWIVRGCEGEPLIDLNVESWEEAK